MSFDSLKTNVMTRSLIQLILFFLKKPIKQVRTSVASLLRRICEIKRRETHPPVYPVDHRHVEEHSGDTIPTTHTQRLNPITAWRRRLHLVVAHCACARPLYTWTRGKSKIKGPRSGCLIKVCTRDSLTFRGGSRCTTVVYSRTKSFTCGSLHKLKSLQCSPKPRWTQRTS